MKELNQWDFDNWIQVFKSNDLPELMDKGRRFLELGNLFKVKGYSYSFDMSKKGKVFSLRLIMKKNG